MSHISTSNQRGAIVLNTIAVIMTIAPIVSMAWFGYQVLAPDTRQVTELAAIAPAERPALFKEPLVSVTFDDGWESVYSEAAPLMSEYEIVSTQYILPGSFADKKYISIDQAKSLKEAGHEITSHTYTHRDLTKLSEKNVIKELTTSKDVLQKFELIEPEANFAAPLGAVNEPVNNLIRQHYYSSRNTMGNLNDGISGADMNLPGKFDRYNIIGYTVGQYTTDDQFKAALEYAKVHNAWFIPIYHQVDNSGTKYSVSPDTFKRHMKMISESSIKTATMRDVLQSYKGGQS